jgi:hypothetical protein
MHDSDLVAAVVELSLLLLYAVIAIEHENRVCATRQNAGLVSAHGEGPNLTMDEEWKHTHKKM